MNFPSRSSIAPVTPLSDENLSVAAIRQRFVTLTKRSCRLRSGIFNWESDLESLSPSQTNDHSVAHRLHPRRLLHLILLGPSGAFYAANGDSATSAFEAGCHAFSI